MFFMHLLISTAIIVAATGSGLHGSCVKNEQCGTLDTYCKNETCVCKDDFLVFQDHCIRLATPHISCTHKTECSTLLGPKGFCKNHKCVCKSFHHFHNNQCVKSRGLDEQCEHNFHCYCGQDCNETIECSSEKMCSCKFGFKRYGRRCVRDPNIVMLHATESSAACNLVFNFSLLLWIFFIRFY